MLCRHVIRCGLSLASTLVSFSDSALSQYTGQSSGSTLKSSLNHLNYAKSFTKVMSFILVQAIFLCQVSLGSAAQIQYTEAPPVRDGAKIKELIDWTPTGAPEFRKQPLGECEPYNVRAKIASHGPSGSPAFTKETISNCLDKWEIPSSMIGNLIEFSAINYNYEGNRSFKYLKIKLPNSKIVRGIIGIKEDSRPRPLIIATCGVMCDAGDRTSEYLLMKFFDESPFHVLVLGNHNSTTFVEDNKVGGFGGGIIAGETILRLARDLRSPENPLSSKISNIFVYGLSLGGHEALYASYLHQRMVEMGGKPVIDGFALNSPVVDFPQTIQRLSTRSIVKIAYGIALKGMFKVVSSLIGYDLEASLKDPDAKDNRFEIDAKLFFANQKAYNEKFPRLEEWELPRVSTEQELLEQTRFENFVGKTTLPTLLFASKDDPVVRPYQNALLLDTPELQDRYGVIYAKKGSHMGAALAYGWRNTSLLYQSYFLSLAPEFWARMKNYVVQIPDLSDWKPGKLIKKRKGSRIVRVDWKAHEGQDVVDLRVAVTGFSNNEPPVCKEDISQNPMACTTLFKIPVRFSDFPTSLRIPATEQEAAALTRWLNVQVDIVDDSGNSPVDTQKLPALARYVEL